MDSFQAGWSSSQLGQLDQLQAEAVTQEQLTALSDEQRSSLLEAEYGDDVSLAESEEATERVMTTADDDDNDGKNCYLYRVECSIQTSGIKGEGRCPWQKPVSPCALPGAPFLKNFTPSYVTDSKSCYS